MGSAAVLSVSLATGTAAAQPSEQVDGLPNIVLIMCDDMGFSDIGCYGGEIATPNIDRLAAGGLRFTQFYNTSKCFPSRGCLLTGAYAQQVGMGRGFGELKNSVTLGEVLRTVGYRTLWTGKHHGTENPVTRGFDRYFGLRDGCCNYFNPGEQREGEGKPARKRKRSWCIDEETYHPYTPPEKDFYTTDYFTKYALSYLEEYKDEEKPFFLYLAYTAPHDPLMAWPEDIAKYRGRYMAGWEKVRNARYKRQLDMGLIEAKFALSQRESGDWDTLSQEKREEADLTMAVYAAMIDRMDQNIGKLLDKIKELGEEENTLVLFCADNGGSAEMVRMPGSGEIGTLTRWTSVGGAWANVSNTPFRKYKNFSHEGGIATPLVAYWPRVIRRGGAMVRRPAHLVDFMATFVDISGAEYPETFGGRTITPMKGQSLLPIFQGKEIAERPPIFWQWSRGKAVRKGKWKLVCFGGDWELYDMDVDRTETNDLAADHPRVVAELSALWEEWYADCYAGEATKK